LAVLGRVFIAVQHQSTVRADVGANGKTLVDARATAATILARVRWINRFHSLAGARCLVSEERQEVAPSGVVDGGVEARLAAGPVMEIAAVAV
jgi:hypothetical protein